MLYSLRIFLVVILLFPILSKASFTGKVEFVKGKPTFNGKVIENSQTLEGKGSVVTASGEVVRIRFESGLFTIGPNSDVTLDWKNAREDVSIINGTTRWLTKKLEEGGETKGPVFKARVASFGLRGTDFIIIRNKLLDEAETVVFEGRIIMQNNRNKKDRKVIGENQWGGIGGRYGQSIGNILTLGSEQIEALKKLL